MLTKLRDDRILLPLLHPCALQFCCALHSFAFVFCSHTHPFLFLSTWFRSGVDSRHSDQGCFCCIFVCLCLEFSEAHVRVTLDLVLLSLGLSVTAIWISVTVTWTSASAECEVSVPPCGTENSKNVQFSKISSRDCYSKAARPAVFHSSNMWFRVPSM